MMKQILLSIIVVFCTIVSAAGQYNPPKYTVDKSRQLFHELVDRAQKRLLSIAGSTTDGIVNLSDDETVNVQIAYYMIAQVDELQQQIEADSAIAGMGKVKYIKGLETLITSYNNNIKRKNYPVTIAPDLVQAFGKAIQLDRKNESIEPIVKANRYEVGKLIIECFSHPENVGIKASKLVLSEKYLVENPSEILTYIQKNPDVATDSLLILAAFNNPNKFYDYAAAGDRLGMRIRQIDDPFVKTLSRMAASRSGQMYYPFLDLLINQKISFEEIDAIKNNDLVYYKLLVKTRIGFAERMLGAKKDTPMEMNKLTDMLTSKAKEVFIREINGLHEISDEKIRFKALESLSPQELYYLCVVGEDEIYTSSYLGVFKRIFQRMKIPRGDSLIMSVRADYFRKFIKMAAGYNTLDTLLKSMPPDDAYTLMRAFMSRLETATNVNNVEDAVDVADSYSSIFETNKKLAKNMREEAQLNYDRCVKNNDKNGVVVYKLESTLFESADTTKKIDVSKELGIPPVYSVNFSSLADDSGKVIQQVFFYGDEDQDGQNSYINFKALFAGKPEWKITENADWLTIKSTRGKKVWIFANKPLYGPEDPDAKAQAKLADYLQDMNLKPTIFIHRGHSYHVKYSLKQIQPTARIVILGSCGGYNNLNEVLTISNDAHIISSKQVGTKTVNEPILREINNALINGKNIEWLPLWKKLSKEFVGKDAKDKFNDYAPPYKNLGALFIKAYRLAMNSEQ
jgi:hypothetical protein